MYVRLLLCALLITFLSACGAPSTNTLEPLLVQDGDFPADFSGGQVQTSVPSRLPSEFGSSQVISRQIAQNRKTIGDVTLFIYETQTDRDAAFEEILKGELYQEGGIIDSKSGESKLGERVAVTWKMNGAGEADMEITFVRCSAVVDIRMLAYADVSVYAQRLDERLKSTLCS